MKFPRCSSTHHPSRLIKVNRQLFDVAILQPKTFAHSRYWSRLIAWDRRPSPLYRIMSLSHEVTSTISRDFGTSISSTSIEYGFQCLNIIQIIQFHHSYLLLISKQLCNLSNFYNNVKSEVRHYKLNYSWMQWITSVYLLLQMYYFLSIKQKSSFILKKKLMA